MRLHMRCRLCWAATYNENVHTCTKHIQPILYIDAVMCFSQTEKYTQIHALCTFTQFSKFCQNTLSWQQEAEKLRHNNPAVNISLRLIDAKHMCSYIEKAHEW